MNQIKVISVDMFQTLVDVFTRKQAIWEELLGKDFSPELYEKGWTLMDRKISEYFTVVTGKSSNFIRVREIFTRCSQSVFETMSLDINPVKAADILVRQHALSEPYDDTRPFLKSVNTYPVCIASDADNDMMGVLTQEFAFDQIFTSEEISAYKLSPGGKFFSRVASHYPVAPSEILHIGDSPADVSGAAAAGITTCWLNRKGNTWKHKIKPDHTVTTLMEIPGILGKPTP